MNALQNRWHCSIGEIYAAGMITSDTGLCEIQHIVAPADLPRLAAGVQVRTIPEISDVPFCFVPGIRFEADDPDGADMLRGEEVEVFGMLAPEDGEKQLFIHFGSHNKIICVEDGSITRAVGRMQSYHFKKFGSAVRPCLLEDGHGQHTAGLSHRRTVWPQPRAVLRAGAPEDGRHHTAAGSLSGAGSTHLCGLAGVPAFFCTGVQKVGAVRPSGLYGRFLILFAADGNSPGAAAESARHPL